VRTPLLWNHTEAAAHRAVHMHVLRQRATHAPQRSLSIRLLVSSIARALPGRAITTIAVATTATTTTTTTTTTITIATITTLPTITLAGAEAVVVTVLFTQICALAKLVMSRVPARAVARAAQAEEARLGAVAMAHWTRRLHNTKAHVVTGATRRRRHLGDAHRAVPQH
jgi:hypothetical protein